MWKLLTAISLTACALAAVDAAPPESSVWVECCGRLRHGVVAIGGESTGTTITFNRTIWELRLRDDAAQEFAEEHHRKPVKVIGTLKRVVGIETKERWIVDVRAISEFDAERDREGTRLAVRGTLQHQNPGHGGAAGWTVEADRYAWPADLTEDPELRDTAATLVGRTVLVTGSLERVPEPGTEPADSEESEAQLVIRIRTLKPAASVPVPGHSD